MALVLRTVKDFSGTCEIHHQVYWPFLDNEAYLARESSPMACRILGPNSPVSSNKFSSHIAFSWEPYLTCYGAFKFLSRSCLGHAEPIPLEIIPPDSLVPLEVMPPSSGMYYNSSFASSSSAAGNFLILVFLLMPFAMLLYFILQLFT